MELQGNQEQIGRTSITHREPRPEAERDRAPGDPRQTQNPGIRDLRGPVGRRDGGPGAQQRGGHPAPHGPEGLRTHPGRDTHENHRQRREPVRDERLLQAVTQGLRFRRDGRPGEAAGGEQAAPGPRRLQRPAHHVELQVSIQAGQGPREDDGRPGTGAPQRARGSDPKGNRHEPGHRPRPRVALGDSQRDLTQRGRLPGIRPRHPELDGQRTQVQSGNRNGEDHRLGLHAQVRGRSGRIFRRGRGE
ncbi:hypothetical protein HPB48_017978 [Haemaphysalis longicornis]|uniref:Uncharacterized protein n=1 Tax=Haemaphysalis longicornis TaxID=44386 RepID=A0A9J6F816_HAELO|nr:hypothetical protein HPB48_017978 [Haemaphysalis longicornis]